MGDTKTIKKHKPIFSKGDIYRCEDQNNKRCGMICAVICSNTLGQVLVTYADGHRVWLKGTSLAATHKYLRKDGQK